MTKIKVKVTQAGGTEDDIILGSGPVTVTLTTDDRTTVPDGITLALNVTGPGSLGSQNNPTSGSGTSSEGFSFTCNQGVQGAAYTVTPSGTTLVFEDLTGTVGAPSFEDVSMNRSTAGASMSFFQKLRLFFLRLFGSKAT
jgi:hypothetical protein